MTDPLTQLIADLDRHGRASLQWAVQWSPDGTLTRAWNVSADGRAMARILEMGGAVRAEKYHAKWTRSAVGAQHDADAAVGSLLAATARALRAVSARETGAFGKIARCGVSAAVLSAGRVKLDLRWRLAARELRAHPPPTLADLVAGWKR